jgi:acyl carrier protein
MSVHTRLREFIGEELGHRGDAAELTDEYPLIEREAIDSMGILRLVSFIEDEFGVVIDDEDLLVENFATIGDIARLVDSKRVA